MVVVIVILTIVVFVLVDLSLRLALRRREEARVRREREKALDVGLRLEWSEEAASLKRVAVEGARARILAVDDEPVVLDSFRKILVLEGYAVDTVETAQEALGLVRKRDYDFVFTDLKMPGMDGLDLTKAVKHLRPDIDVVMITGYATIESAVEAMKFGAMDYVEKPFTPEELAEFTKKLLYLRQDRLEKASAPKVHLVTPTSPESESARVVNVPGGAFVTPQHTWVSVEITGEARIGLDDFARKTLTGIEEIDFPTAGARVEQGEPLFTVRRGERALAFPAPVGGQVSRVNHELTYQLDLLERLPVVSGWICCLLPDHLSEELGRLRIGADAIPWYEAEIQRFGRALVPLAPPRDSGAPARASEQAPEEVAPQQVEARWSAFAGCFLEPQRAEVPA